MAERQAWTALESTCFRTTTPRCRLIGKDPRASLNVLDALMETRIADSYESSLKATLRISTELDAAIEHASWLINNEVLELEYDEHPKPAHEDNIAPEEIPY